MSQSSWSNLSFASTNKLRPTHRFSGAYRGINKSNIEEAKKDSKEKDKRGPGQQPIGIAALSIDFDPPVEGCEINPYVLLQVENGTQPLERDDDCSYKWFKGQKRICDYPSCSKAAELQCMVSVKIGLPTTKSFFCSPTHFRTAWTHYHYREVTDRIKELDLKNDGKSIWLPWDHDDGEIDNVSPEKTSNTTVREGIKDEESKKQLYCRFPCVLSNTWSKVSEKGTYTPEATDIGCMLLLEVQPKLDTKNSSNKKKAGQCIKKDTKPVLERPPPPPTRSKIPRETTHNANDQPFSVMTYNILAQLYTNSTIYPYCPLYALLWTYRKHNLLREILTLSADIICLQEVQNDHFEEFFLPNLSEKGYDGIFKGKTRGDIGGGREDPEVSCNKKMDGCAIFYKKDRFALMEQYHVEFNEAAKHMFKNYKTQFHSNSRAKYPKLMKRLLKGNIALVLVLEEIPPPDNSRRRGRTRKRRLCVANTHIYWDPEFADIKLWQTWVLCQELSKLVSQRDLPLILAGDFNSQPESAVYKLLGTQQLTHDGYEAFKKDNLDLLPVHTQISHELQLTSAYAFMGEPKYTNYTGHFIGILDYIWYTKSSVGCLGVLDVGSPEDIVGVDQEATALPSRLRPSDHLSLFSTFVFL